VIYASERSRYGGFAIAEIRISGSGGPRPEEVPHGEPAVADQTTRIAVVMRFVENDQLLIITVYEIP
jgi:hypothetical protein